MIYNYSLKKYFLMRIIQYEKYINYDIHDSILWV